MNNLNNVILEGNLTRDPELKYTPSGTEVCLMSVANNRYYKKADEKVQEVSYIDVEAWAGLGVTCKEYLSKGRGVRVVGRLKQDRWTDADGNSRSRVKLVAEHVDFKPIFNAS